MNTGSGERDRDRERSSRRNESSPFVTGERERDRCEGADLESLVGSDLVIDVDAMIGKGRKRVS